MSPELCRVYTRIRRRKRKIIGTRLKRHLFFLKLGVILHGTFMGKLLQIALLEALLVSLTYGSSSCPLMIASSTADQDGIRLTFRNAGKLPIRRLDFRCTATRRGKTQSGNCLEKNAMFFPGPEYSVSYSYPDGKPEPVMVSVRSLTWSNGYIWKPSKRNTCRVMNIHPPRKAE